MLSGIFNVLDAKLQSLGFVLSDNSDFHFNIQSKSYRAESKSSVGVGVGGSDSHVGGAVSVGIPIEQSKMTRQMMFDFIDENGIGLFWQAVTESTYSPNASPEARKQSLESVLDKVFNKYPPEIK